MTRDFVTSLYGAPKPRSPRVAILKESMAATREVMDPKFSSFAFTSTACRQRLTRVRRSFGIDDPVIWTDKRDQEMWTALQGGG